MKHHKTHPAIHFQERNSNPTEDSVGKNKSERKSTLTDDYRPGNRRSAFGMSEAHLENIQPLRSSLWDGRELYSGNGRMTMSRDAEPGNVLRSINRVKVVTQ